VSEKGGDRSSKEGENNWGRRRNIRGAEKWILEVERAVTAGKKKIQKNKIRPAGLLDDRTSGGLVRSARGGDVYKGIGGGGKEGGREASIGAAILAGAGLDNEA